MRSDVFLYLAGPITATPGFSVERNVADALTVYHECLNRGLPTFCPQLNGMFPSAHANVTYETWMAFAFAVIPRCTHLVLLPRWESSAGAMRERIYALKLGLQVVLISDLSRI